MNVTTTSGQVRTLGPQLTRKAEFSDLPHDSATSRSGYAWEVNQAETFITACCQCGPELNESGSHLYEGYSKWAAGVCCQRMSAVAFSLAVSQLGFAAMKSYARRWVGIKYIPDRGFGLGLTVSKIPEADFIDATMHGNPDASQISCFIDECCERNASERSGATALFNAYLSWAQRTRRPAMTQTLFSRTLRRLGFYKRKAGSMYVLGLRVLKKELSQTNEPSGTGGLTLPRGRDLGRVA